MIWRLLKYSIFHALFQRRAIRNMRKKVVLECSWLGLIFSLSCKSDASFCEGKTVLLVKIKIETKVIRTQTVFADAIFSSIRCRSFSLSYETMQQLRMMPRCFPVCLGVRFLFITFRCFSRKLTSYEKHRRTSSIPPTLRKRRLETSRGLLIDLKRIRKADDVYAGNMIRQLRLIQHIWK